ncbi:C-type lectin domain family 2 member B-like [Mixophyes fleayi]|uniref:C-type lectin domain family 2 member B-like n=1 Tax=Mixophyes fleayi TaxID=3061075 RepID=UPI003F4DA2A7
MMKSPDPDYSKYVIGEPTIKCRSNKWVYLFLTLNLVTAIITLLIILTSLLPRTVTLGISIEKTMPCESNWIWYHGKCYHFSDTRETWTNSQKICLSQNASLALIDSEVELNFLNRFKGIDNHWIGLRWSSDNNGWTWTNGTLHTNKLFSIESASANSDKSECVFLNHEGVKSENGKHEKKWICRRRSFFAINMQNPEVWRAG